MEKNVKSKLTELQQLLDRINDFLGQAPEGCLKIQQRNGRTYYYHQFYSEMSHSRKKKYIPRKEENLAKKLAQKGYYVNVKPIIEKQIAALKRFGQEYCRKELEHEYEILSEERKKLVHPIRMSVNIKVEQWKNEEFEANSKYAEGLIFETENGELVRSKSELIIANALFHSSSLLYKYERPIELTVNGRKVLFYPDFTIINTHTGKIFYWEHAGRMDDSGYANDFVKKINIYAENNIIPGKNLIVTYETRDCPLSMRSVKAVLAFYEE